jgi:LmbE family N-acetylglucosaminyl deacetylase
MIVAAHPDDEVLGCGGTIARLLKAGSKFHVVVLGEGSSSRYPNSEFNSSLVKREIRKRKTCATTAFKSLGVSSFEFYETRCGLFDQTPILEVGKTLEREIQKFRPDTIFTHSRHDVNVDHQIAFQATIQAARPTGNNRVRRLYSYEVLSSSEWKFVDQFQPNFFVPLSIHEMNRKIAALAAYKSEIKPFPYPRSREGLLALAQFRGMQCNSNFAEGFQLVREFYFNRLDS